MKNHTSLFVATAMTAAVSALSSGSLHAQEATPPTASSTIEEVLVTARRRSESMQEIPVSMTAFTSSDIAEVGITDISHVSELTPNLSFCLTRVAMMAR